MHKNKPRIKKYKILQKKNNYRIKNSLKQAFTYHKTMIENNCQTTMMFKCKKIIKQVL